MLIHILQRTVIFLLLNESYVIHKNIIFLEIKFHLYNQTHMLMD